MVGLEIGGDDYIVKPFSPREVSARVKAVLRRAGAPRSASSGMWAVDENRRRIAYFGQGLELSRYEYEILKTLIRSPGQVFSRERLMDLVWDSPETSLDRAVDAHIKNIRAKLRRIAPDREAIVTMKPILSVIIYLSLRAKKSSDGRNTIWCRRSLSVTRKWHTSGSLKKKL